VEERLHHVALALPQLALARHDALAEQNPDAIQADALGVVAMIGNQHPLDVIRVVNDIGIRSACRHEHAIDVSKTGEQLEHALQGVIRGADVELQLSLGGLGGRWVGRPRSCRATGTSISCIAASSWSSSARAD